MERKQFIKDILIRNETVEKFEDILIKKTL